MTGEERRHAVAGDAVALWTRQQHVILDDNSYPIQPPLNVNTFLVIHDVLDLYSAPVHYCTEPFRE